MKTHVKTVKLKYIGLLYNVHVFTVQSTMQKCRWYSKFQVYSYSTTLGAAIKFKTIQRDNCKPVYSGLLYCVHFFTCD